MNTITKGKNKEGLKLSDKGEYDKDKNLSFNDQKKSKIIKTRILFHSGLRNPGLSIVDFFTGFVLVINSSKILARGYTMMQPRIKFTVNNFNEIGVNMSVWEYL